MSGLSSTLSIAKTAIAVQQYGINITGQNIANVNNPDYSTQKADQINRTPAPYAGFLFGTGVDMVQIQQNVNQLLENRLTGEISTQAFYEEQEAYMRVLEGFFDEDTENSISTVMSEFWSSWHDLSNNPEGSSERVAVLETGTKLAASFESTILSIDSVTQDITLDLQAAVIKVNSLSKQIAELNMEVSSSENGRTNNDVRDQRNKLIDELGELIDITVFERGNGSVTVNAMGNYTLVAGTETYDLKLQGKEVVWEASDGSVVEVSEKIGGGRIGGMLVLRDEVVPKYRAEVNELARQMIWTMNYQHSQGAGLTYMDEPVIGTYTTDESGWLTSYGFGDKIDFSKDFTMWVEDSTTVDTEYSKVQMDMSLSEAQFRNWMGSAPGGNQSIYKFTVLDDAVLGDKEVSESDGDGLGRVWGLGTSAGTLVTAALDNAIADQTLTIYNSPSGTQVFNVQDIGGDAKRSAASIAAALNTVEGVDAYASETSATLDPANITNAEDGDEVRFSLYVDGYIQEHSFIRDSSLGTVQEQFEDALLEVVEAVNNAHQDQDLSVDGQTITSASGKTLGLQEFEVVDNAGISFTGFTNFNAGDTVTFTVDSMSGTSAATTTSVSIDLTGVDTSDQEAMAQAVSAALAEAFTDEPFTVVHDPSINGVILRTTDGSDIRVRDAGNDSGNNATITLTSLAGTSDDGANVDAVLDFTAAANDTARFNSNTSTADSINFSGNGWQLGVNEVSGGAVNKVAVITGTVTIRHDPGIKISTSVSGAGSGGLFDSPFAKTGSSILTFGGEGGFSNFSTAAGSTIDFDLDGYTISLNTTAAGGTSDVQWAMLLEAQILNDLPASVVNNYQVIRTSCSVSVIKKTGLDEPITIENFSDNTDPPATINVSTGTGTGIYQPENDVLDADPARSYRGKTTSTLYGDDGAIMWERLDENGMGTGAYGIVTVEDEGHVKIMEKGVETISFDISAGSLVAGNILTVNTDTSGRPDPLEFRVTGQANSINDMYQFEVVSGGKVGHKPADGDEPIVIQWTNGTENGTFELEWDDPPFTPQTPIEVNVDGMILKFSDGTLQNGDVFTITTGDTGVPLSENDAGQPTGETMSDWHWTLDSFTDQFNRITPGMKAGVTANNHLKFEASDNYYVLDNMEYAGLNGFDEENVTVTVKNWDNVDFTATDLKFERSGNGNWGFANDPTGGNLQLIPEGGDDDGFGVDFNGDGLADMELSFNERVSGDGFVEFDLIQRDGENIAYAFGDDSSEDSGLMAAAGINTFFNGYTSTSMEVNEALTDTRRVAAATIDSATGQISQGDNSNALAMTDLQSEEMEMVIWTYSRGGKIGTGSTTSTLDDFYTQLIGSMGIRSRSIQNSKSFADVMVNSVTEQRDSISAVSLDEEMVKLMQYQHAYTAAAKLLTVTDEMLNTLVSLR